jgi:hypothetical protein
MSTKRVISLTLRVVGLPAPAFAARFRGTGHGQESSAMTPLGVPLGTVLA